MVSHEDETIRRNINIEKILNPFTSLGQMKESEISNGREDLINRCKIQMAA
jgi:hypothetical protein